MVGTDEKMLSDSSDNEEQGRTLAINEHYAKAYQQRKEREELQKRESARRSRSAY